MVEVRCNCRALLVAALIGSSSLACHTAWAQAPANPPGAAGGTATPGSIANTGGTAADMPTVSTTSTTTPGIPPSAPPTDSSVAATAAPAGSEEAGTAPQAPVTPLPHVPRSRRAGLANTGGEPFLMSLSGLALAGSALMLRRKIS